MKHFFQKLPVALGLGLLLLAGGRAQAQVSNYTFAASAGTFTPLPAAATNVPVLLTDDATSGPTLLPLGFTFAFDGLNYTDVKACSNGFLSFNANASYNVGNALAGTGGASEKPLLAPLWDDLSGAGATARASYLTTGTAPNRVFTFEWLNWKWSYAAAAPSISFQVKLYEDSNRIEYVYRPEAAAPSTGPSFGASIGLAGGTTGTTASEFVSLNNTSAAPVASNSTETTTLTTAPAAGQVYGFTPPTGGCLGVRNLMVSSTTFNTAVLTFQTTPGTTGYTLTVQPAGGTVFMLNLPAGTTSPYTITGLSPNTSYTATITGQCGGATSPTATTTFMTRPAAYCTAGVGGSCGSADITTVVLAGSGLNATGLSCTATGTPADAYTAYPATAPTTGTLAQGSTYALNVTTAAAGIVSAWVDWNRNYQFEASEWVQVSTRTVGGSPATVQLLVPATAVVGQTALRIRSRLPANNNGAADACTNFGTGEVKDFILTVTGAATCPTPTGLAVSSLTSTGATLSYTPVAGGSGTYTVSYGPAGFNPATGGTAVPNAGPSTPVTGLTPGTAYELYVVYNCPSGPSQAAGPLAFGTPPANDDPCNAVVLPLLGPCAPQSFSSVGATVTTSPNTSAGQCLGANINPRDVWFAVTTRASGPGSTSLRLNVTGNAAARVQLLRVNPSTGNGCAGPFIGVMCVGSAANTAAPMLDVPTGLVPSTTYYVRVHGANFNDPLGPFTICATAAGLLGSRVETTATALHVYPNPSGTGLLTVQLPAGHSTATTTLLNSLGQAVRHETLAAGQADQTLPTRGLPAGVYTLRVAMAGEVLTRKVVLE